jgi:hypothetical protein
MKTGRQLYLNVAFYLSRRDQYDSVFMKTGVGNIVHLTDFWCGKIYYSNLIIITNFL